MGPITVPVFNAGDSASGPRDAKAESVQRTTADPNQEEPQGMTNETREHDAEPHGVDGQKKRRKKHRKAIINVSKHGTGFEGMACLIPPHASRTCPWPNLRSSPEFYADPPITPEEAAEEGTMYSP